MTRSYDPLFVIASVLVAMLASYAALDLAGRVRSGSGATRRGWIAAGGVVMGLGIWGMHFVGMLAFHLPVAIEYDVPLMLLSMAVAIGASLLALVVINRPELGVRTAIPASALMGGAIAGMHYIGMASMRMGAGVSYDPATVVASVLIAMIASMAALWLAFRFRSDLTIQGTLFKILGAVVLGAAISGTHYAGMAAARFVPGAFPGGSVTYIVASGELGETVVEGTILVIVLGLIAAAIDRSIQARNEYTTGLQNQADQISKSEQRTRLIIDTALDAVVSMSSSGVISEWSAQAEKMFGWSRAEAVGKLMSETIIPPRYRDGHNKGLKKFLETGKGAVLNRRIEVTGLNRDGHEFPIELAISPAKVDDEWTFSAFIRDLTEQKKAEEALRLGEQRYRELFEDVPVGLYRSTPEGGLIDVNPAMVSMLGFPDRQSLLTTAATSLYVNPADRLRWSAQMKGDGAVLDFDVQMRRADGAVIWASDTTHVKRGPDGSVLLYEGVLEDITARVEAERALQANQRRLNQILEAVPIGIFVSDAMGTPTFANAAAKKMLGRDVFPGRGVGDLAEVYKIYLAGTDDLYPLERMPLIKALRGVAATVDDMEIREAGHVVSLTVHGAPILDNDGTVVAAVVAFVDNTGRKSLESQLRQASKMEAVGQLAGGVAHDFNNLLTVIMSYSAMLMERLDPANSDREDVKEIAAAADRAAALTRQLLAFSRQQVMQPRVINVNAVIGDLEKMLGRLIGEDIELVTALDPHLATIFADPGQLEQVLMNLAVNARDAMPGGGRLTISTSNSELREESGSGTLHAVDGDYVMLAVGDTGTGMTREVQQRLFEPFFTTKESGRGTGLGLATVYGIVNQSGGELYVYSEIGEGSTFKVYFPRFTARAAERPLDIKSKESPRGSETVLLVEDDANLRGLVARVLNKCGYNVIVAAGGLDALAIAFKPETLIHAVITDVVMPGMNGRELVDRLIKSRPKIASLLMSGYTDDEVLRRGVLHGGTAFLQKPFTPDQLARKVRDVLDLATIAPAA
jgi:two-component system cell cycle sensor histidine kinase/response regulator CckA